jgi:hypothetical protein
MSNNMRNDELVFANYSKTSGSKDNSRMRKSEMKRPERLVTFDCRLL